MQKQKKLQLFPAKVGMTVHPHPSTSLGILFSREEPQPHTKLFCFSSALLPCLWLYKIFWDFDFDHVQMRIFQNKAFYIKTWVLAGPCLWLGKRSPIQPEMNWLAGNETTHKAVICWSLNPEPCSSLSRTCFSRRPSYNPLSDSLMQLFSLKTPSKVLSQSPPLKNHYKQPCYKWLYYLLRDPQVNVKVLRGTAKRV